MAGSAGLSRGTCSGRQGPLQSAVEGWRSWLLQIQAMQAATCQWYGSKVPLGCITSGGWLPPSKVPYTYLLLILGVSTSTRLKIDKEPDGEGDQDEEGDGCAGTSCGTIPCMASVYVRRQRQENNTVYILPCPSGRIVAVNKGGERDPATRISTCSIMRVG